MCNDQRLAAETIWRLPCTAALDFHQGWPKETTSCQQGFRNSPFALLQRQARFLSLENAPVLRCPDRAYGHGALVWDRCQHLHMLGGTTCLGHRERQASVTPELRRCRRHLPVRQRCHELPQHLPPFPHGQELAKHQPSHQQQRPQKATICRRHRRDCLPQCTGPTCSPSTQCGAKRAAQSRFCAISVRTIRACASGCLE